MSRNDGRPLTAIEERILVLSAAGRTRTDVAAELRVSVKTVEWHLARAARKLGAGSRSDVAAVVARWSAGRSGVSEEGP
jgi:DNA-binding CsgD family transcriptional regulator